MIMRAIRVLVMGKAIAIRHQKVIVLSMKSFL